MWTYSVATDQGSAEAQRDRFRDLTQRLRSRLAPGEEFLCDFRREMSTFARFNRGRVGQIGTVEQAQAEIDLLAGRHHAAGTVALSGDSEADDARIGGLLCRLRAAASASVEDPYLLFSTDPEASSERIATGRLPPTAALITDIGKHATGIDLVGIYAAGAMQRGFASSFGQINWHSTETFHLDWSAYDERGRGAKSSYAGVDWNPAEFAARMEICRQNLALAGNPARDLPPGRYRVYLAPAALAEMMSLLAWGGFGLRAQRTKTSPLQRLYDGRVSLAACVTLADDIAGGAAPAFERSGFARPGCTPLIDAGCAAGSLVSPRSAMEFGVATNGAEADEAPVSLDMAAGTLDADRIAVELDTGVLVSNLWYLNFSDRSAGRITGMTRYATMWVEEGRVRGPVEAMRFDDSIYRMLGSNLVGLTRQREWIADADSYGWRSSRSARLPGALIDDIEFTL